MSAEFGFEKSIDDISVVPEGYKDYYNEKDGKYELDGRISKFVDDNKGLLGALEKERSNNRELNKKLRSWSDVGVEPDEIRDLIDDVKTKRSELKKNKDEIISEEVKVYQKQLEEKAAELEALQKENKEEKIRNKIVSAIKDANGSELLLSGHVRNQVELFAEDGNQELRVIDKGSKQPRITSNGSYMTLSDLLEEMKGHDQFGMGFSATVTKSAQADNGAKNVPVHSDDSREARMEKYLAMGGEAYRNNIS